MRGFDIFCASQAATAIRLGMDEASSSSSSPSSTIHLGGSRAIDRHNPIIRDSSRLGKSFHLAAPCASQTPPIAPIPYKHLHHKARKSSSKPNDQAKKSSSKSSTDQKKKSAIAKPSHEGEINIRKSWAKPGDFISPPGSSRYLLGETALPDFDPVLALVPEDPTKSQPVKPDESSASNSKPASSSSSSSSSSSHSPNQEVVLRVSLHCKGCEGKVRKHISRMQGVTSFNIDFAAKKVTVVGDVTPLDVLASISKVKSAQLWAPAMSAPVPAASSSSSYSEIKKSHGVLSE